jgi:hypothetical protein
MFSALVRTYELSMDCHMDRALLESEGIATQVLFDQYLTLDPLMAQACGGIELRVGQHDLERAIQLTGQTSPIFESNSCPNCISQNLIYNWRQLRNFTDWFVFIGCFLLGVYPLRYAYATRCNNCHQCFTFEL